MLDLYVIFSRHYFRFLINIGLKYQLHCMHAYIYKQIQFSATDNSRQFTGMYRVEKSFSVVRMENLRISVTMADSKNTQKVSSALFSRKQRCH